jgi:predicted nucleotidyltransferase
MSPGTPAPSAAAPELPAVVERVLADFVTAARSAFADDLMSVVLFGSAAEGRMRATSDVNVVVVLRAFTPASAGRLTDALRAAEAAVRLSAMFLLESEVASAAEAFAAKFADIRRRRRVLLGEDPFASLSIPRAAEIARVRQVLLNLTLRARAAYAARSDHEDALARLVADMAGPLRACAAAVLELEGLRPETPRAALAQVAIEAGAADETEYDEALARLSQARESGRLPAGVAAPILFRLTALADHLRARVEVLR